MIAQGKTILVICEGYSEAAYLQELNRLFREMEIAVVFHPCVCGNGFYGNVAARYRHERQKNRRSPIYIWVDWDLYARNERRNLDNYSNRPSGIPAFCFSRQNFEDFLATHLDAEQLGEWIAICRQRHHWEVPLHSAEYLELFKTQLFADYQKGALPFELSPEMLRQMLENQNIHDCPAHCEFAEVIRRAVEASAQRPS